ncbi:SCP2 sterol-binding domain-containing protein [Ideonella sp. A 288]|uniref:SCP2 sterol-binding domain-containing protein n=1 Tax=Ideonella sp. A 288 TaxID=1962181 RepID=UPI000B4AE49C|nr:SCP2 sterol-binding domain-containing protein [Ideonella sp. A 288]
MDITAATDTLRAKVGNDCGIGAVLKFDCGADGVVVLDGRSVPNTVDNADRDADCTIAITLANLGDLLTGELEPTTGFMMGKFKVSGDMSVALKLQRVV